MRRKVSPVKLIWTIIVAALVLVWLYPVILSVLTSLKTTEQIAHNPFSLPYPPTWKAFVDAWQVLGFQSLLLNSAIYGVGGSLLALVLGILPAFAFTRFRIPGGMIIFVMILTTLMLPQQTVIIPLYNLLHKFGLLNTRLGLIIVHGVYGMAFQLLILSGFVSSIPKELEMAARVDGCSDIGILRWIIVPLTIPAAAVAITLNFIDIWKEFFFALVFLSDQSVMPVTLGILTMSPLGTTYFTSINLPAATVIMSQIPIIVLFIFAYRWISSGIFVGSVKG